MTEKQRSERECYIACVATATGKHAELDALLNAKEIGATDLVDRVWSIVGMKRDVDFRSGFYGHLSELDATYGPSTLRDFLWGRRALIQVPSLNFGGEQHVVYWDGSSLFDAASAPRQYTKLEELPMTGYITWFNEVNK